MAQTEPPKAARLWRDAALRARKLRGGPGEPEPEPDEGPPGGPPPPPPAARRPPLGELEALNLSGRGLEELPEEVGAALSGLRVLSLRRNRMCRLPGGRFSQ